MPRRLTRRESTARTRARLIDAAAQEFVRSGLERTSIERIARRAGFTRGAFYAHFANKDAICMAILEERFDGYLKRFAAVLATDVDPETRARRAGDDYSLMVDQDRDAQQLLFEFSVYALRNERFQAELVARLRRLRGRITEVFRERAAAHGIAAPIPFEQLTLITFASANGVALARLLEPDQFGDQLYGELLGLLFAGLGVMAQRPQGESGEAHGDPELGG